MNKLKILICDDEEGVRESLTLIVERDYESILAASAADAVSIVRNEKDIKAVLMDIKMPDKTGLEALKEIKKINPDLPVIMITGYQSTEMAAEAIKHGALDYIIKPINSAAVLSSINKAT